MSKMYNMVPKERDNKGEVCLSEDSSYEYPVEINVKGSKFPPMKEMKIGKEYVLTVCVKPVRMSVNKKEEMDMTLQVIEMGESKESKEDMKKEEELDGMVAEMYPKKNKK